MKQRHGIAIVLGVGLGLAGGAGAEERLAGMERGELQLAVERSYPAIERLYLELHRHPELSGQEKQTAARLASALRRLGFEVTTGVGGHGVVAILKNGAGPSVMLRTELDGLPVKEKTGLPYASVKRAEIEAASELDELALCIRYARIY